MVPDAVEFLAFAGGPAGWANAVMRMLETPPPAREDWNSAVRDSAFSIENSAATLLTIYQQPLAAALGASASSRLEWAGN